jgi:hypothetical protein
MRSFISFFYIILLAGCTQIPSNGWDPNSYVEQFTSKGISPEVAGNYIGKEVLVTGRVVSSYFAEKESGSPTFLNLDKSFPDNALSVIIFKNYLDTLQLNVLDLENHQIEISGKVSQYTDEFGKIRPSIEIRSMSQIKVL